jgi:hypothetical protein
MTPARPTVAREVGGAFGDLGTLLPILLGAVAVAGMSAGGVLVGFGAFLLVTGLLYRLPLPVQPMKAIGALVIAGGLMPRPAPVEAVRRQGRRRRKASSGGQGREGGGQGPEPSWIPQGHPEAIVQRGSTQVPSGGAKLSPLADDSKLPGSQAGNTTGKGLAARRISARIPLVADRSR